mmetsp:Transcript_31278/g.85948  ORF Transcript_31278/g.85948 Transcript_31278/m.85948 type:complete len:203 (+) Transcript_31278:416-1024(+)
MRRQVVDVSAKLLISFQILLFFAFQLREHLLFLEEHLVGCARLILQELLLLLLSLILLVSILEIFLVLLVAGHEVSEGVFQRAYPTLCFSDLLVEFVTLPLQLFLFLGSLDHVVCLALLLLALFLLHLVHHVFVLHLQSIDLLFTFGQFNGGLVPFVLVGAKLRLEHVSVDLDLLFSLLHANLQLLLPVLQAVHILGLRVQL